MAYPLPSWAVSQLGVSHPVGGRLSASINGSGFVVPLDLQGGSVKVDATSPAKRQLSAVVRAHPDDPAVSPLGAECLAEYAIIAPNGATLWVPVGTFVIATSHEADRGLVEIGAVDRWQRVVDARLEQPVATSGATAAAIATLLTGADYRITVDTSAAPSGTHGASLWERERTDAVLALARTIGADVRFDVEGQAVVRPAPSLTDQAAWQIGGGLGGAKVSSRRGTSRERTYNAVVVTGEPPDLPPVYAVARDTSPTSPTRWGGPFGKRTRFYSSQLITSTAQAQAAADAMLARVLGVARTVELEALPNPGLDAGDVIRVEVEPGVWQRHLVESFTLPLGVGTVSLATRSTAEEAEGE